MDQKWPVSIEKRRFHQKGRCTRNDPFPLKNENFVVYSKIAEIRAKFDNFGPQKDKWTGNDPFPFGNCFFLVYSTIAELGCQIEPV